MTQSSKNFDIIFEEMQSEKFGSISPKIEPKDLDVLSRLKENLTKRSIWVYILKLLSRRSLYGYEIQQAISEEFEICPEMSQVSCYKELYRLSQQGLVTSKISDSTARKRKYYFITDLGKRTLGEAARFLRKTYEVLFERDQFNSDIL